MMSEDNMAEETKVNPVPVKPAPPKPAPVKPAPPKPVPVKPAVVDKKVIKENKSNPFAVSVDASKVQGAKDKTNFHDSPLLAFDGYFEILKSKNPGIKEHHRQPIKKFIMESGISIGTKEDFDKVMLKY